MLWLTGEVLNTSRSGVIDQILGIDGGRGIGGLGDPGNLSGEYLQVLPFRDYSPTDSAISVVVSSLSRCLAPPYLECYVNKR